jgi:DNA-binding NarL/FixJ family response regulator
MSVTQKSYRVLVADDHAVVRSGLKQLLEEQAASRYVARRRLEWRQL